MAVLVVTGTGTGVGKTVVTAALAALGRDRGASVAVVKPAQTGLRADEPGDLADVRRLSGVDDLHELIRYPDPLSPAAAARRSGMPTLALHDVVRTVTELAETRRLVLVEGAGGLLVRFDEEGWTLADLAVALGAPAVVVTSAGLGSLNTAALTLETMAHRGVDLAGLVIGDWPQRPDLACRSNVRDLEMLSARPLAGALRQHIGQHPQPEFLGQAVGGLAPVFGGRFDAARFRAASDVWQPVQVRRDHRPDEVLTVLQPDLSHTETVRVAEAYSFDDERVLSLAGLMSNGMGLAGVEVREDESAVHVTVQVGFELTGPGPHYLASISVPWRVEVQLESPLGDRQLYAG